MDVTQLLRRLLLHGIVLHEFKSLLHNQLGDFFVLVFVVHDRFSWFCCYDVIVDFWTVANLLYIVINPLSLARRLLHVTRAVRHKRTVSANWQVGQG